MMLYHFKITRPHGTERMTVTVKPYDAEGAFKALLRQLKAVSRLAPDAFSSVLSIEVTGKELIAKGEK